MKINRLVAKIIYRVAGRNGKALVIKIKAIKNYTLLHLPNARAIKKHLAFLGLSKIEPFRKLNWKSRELYSEYYIAMHNGQKVFVKVSKQSDIIDREAAILTYIQQNKEQAPYLASHTPTVVLHDAFSGFSVIVTDYISGHEIGGEQDIQILSKLSQDLLTLLDEMNHIGLIDMDIRTDNLLVHDDEVYIIDFGMAYCQPLQEKDSLYKEGILPRHLQEFGDDYRPAPGLYDDAYSVLVALKKVCPEYKNVCKPHWKEFNERIGRLSYRFVNTKDDGKGNYWLEYND